MTNGELAFAVVVLASFVVYVSYEGAGLQVGEMMVVILLSLAYLALGTYGERYLRANMSRPLLAVYFLLQIAMASTIVYISEGQAWLVLLPMAGSAFQFLSTPWAVFVSILIWMGQAVPFYRLYGIETAWTTGVMFLAALVFVIVFTQLTIREQRARDELTEAHQKLRAYAAQVEELAVAQERNRLAREIHDGLGHYLTAINVQIRAAIAMEGQDPDQGGNALRNAQKLTEEALADVRRSVSSLRSDPSTSRPLPETVSRLLSEIKAADLKTQLTISGHPRPLPQPVEFTCYRLVQEGLTNVCKHAQASVFSLNLEYLEKSVRVTLQDNGVGSDQLQTGYGLLGLRERCEMLGGNMKIETRRGAGFRLTMEIPG